MIAMKLVELNLFVWILYCSWEESESVNKINAGSNNPSTSTQRRFQGEIRYVIDVVYWGISVVIYSAQQEAKHVESVEGKIVLKKNARQSHMLVRLEGNPMTMTLGPSMTMHLAIYSGRFIPHFATLSEPLRRLTRKETPFKFGLEQKKSFECLKQKMAEACSLAYFDKNAPTEIIADASPVGLGIVLAQEQDGAWTPVGYASRNLTGCEQRYSQTEKEVLGVVWACERYHVYVYGMKSVVETDHKPLEVIHGPRSRPCARIERWFLRLQPYKNSVIHWPKRENIADPLSRLLHRKVEPDNHQ